MSVCCSYSARIKLGILEHVNSVPSIQFSSKPAAAVRPGRPEWAHLSRRGVKALVVLATDAIWRIR